MSFQAMGYLSGNKQLLPFPQHCPYKTFLLPWKEQEKTPPDIFLLLIVLWKNMPRFGKGREGKRGDRMFCLRCLGFFFFFKPNCSPGVFIFCFEIKLYHIPQPSGWSLWVNSVWNLMTTAMMLSVFVLFAFPIPIPQTRGPKKGCITYLSWHRRVIEAWRTKETRESLNLLPGRAYHRDVGVGSLCSSCLTCMPAITGDQAGMLGA